MPKVPKTTRFLRFLQYLKENAKNEVDFLPIINRQRFENDIIIFGVRDQACSNYPK